jgi:hypothetical protein
MPIFFWMLSEEDWQAILTTLLPPDWLRAQFENAFDQLYADLQADRSGSGIKIPMADLKARVNGAEGFNAVLRLIEAQPACTLAQLAQIQTLTDPAAELKDVPICRPPDAVLTSIYPNIRATLAALADQIPDQAELKYGGDDESTGDPLATPRQVLGTLRALALAALLVPIVLLALVALCGARSIKSLLRWLGVPLVVAGALGILVAAAGLIATHVVVSSALQGGQGAHSGMAPGVFDAGVDVMSAVARGYLVAILVEAVVIALIGIGLILSAHFVERPRHAADTIVPTAA